MKRPERTKSDLAHKMLHYFAKRWFCKAVIALCVAASLSISASRSTTHLTARAYMALNYENAEQGLYPNSTRFNMYDVISEDIAQRVIDRAGLNDVVTARSLVSRLSVAPRYTRSTLDRYIGSEYTIRLSLKNQVGHTDATQLLYLLCAAYYEDFVNRFAVNDVISDFALTDTESYDYHEIAQLFSTRISHLRDYLSRRNNENGVFRAESTGETFSGLIKRLDNFKKVLYERYTAFITETGITKDYETYMAEMLYRRSLLEDEYERASTRYAMRLAAIAMYDTRQTAVVMIPTYDANRNFYMSKTRVGMDYIAEAATTDIESAGKVHLNILGSDLKLALLQKTYETALENARAAIKADEMVKSLCDAFGEVINDVLLTDNDYIRHTLSEALSFKYSNVSMSEQYQIKKALLAFVFVFAALSVCQQLSDHLYVRWKVRRSVIDVEAKPQEEQRDE